MSTREISNDCLFMALSEYPSQAGEISKLNRQINDAAAHHVIIDFSLVKMLTSASMSNLLILRGLLGSHNRRLILCNVIFPLKGIFTVCGLNEVFEFASDKFAAQQILRLSSVAKV